MQEEAATKALGSFSSPLEITSNRCHGLKLLKQRQQPVLFSTSSLLLENGPFGTKNKEYLGLSSGFVSAVEVASNRISTWPEAAASVGEIQIPEDSAP